MSKGAKSIRPVVIYPFVQPKDLSGLRALYAHLQTLKSDKRFKKPITIVNNQTKFRNSKGQAGAELASAFDNAISKVVTPNSDPTYVWAVDTCAMWLRGLGDAFETAEQSGNKHDVFWLIPGDFNYATKEGKSALKALTKIPEKVYRAECEICLGEIRVPLNSSKQLIDTYGTYGLLYNWFPAEARGLRKITEKPRTEFFAIGQEPLKQALIDSRWYAYEQTLMILLQNMKGKGPVRRMACVNMGEISDEESTRSSLASAMQQVERTERALKLFWREKAEGESRQNWHEEFRNLSAQSESIRTAAMVILRRLLT